MFRSGASSVNAIVIYTPLCSVRMRGGYLSRMSAIISCLFITFPSYLIYIHSIQTHKKRLTVWRSGNSLQLIPEKSIPLPRISLSENSPVCQPLIYKFESNLQPTLFFLFQLPLMLGFFRPLALYVFQSNKGSHIQAAGAIVLF